MSSDYEILEVDSKATLSEIKNAYQRLIFIYHPDKLAQRGLLPGSQEYKEASDKFIQIHEAYENIKQTYVKKNISLHHSHHHFRDKNWSWGTLISNTVELDELDKFFGNNHVHINERDQYHYTALEISIRNNCLDKMMYLLENGANINLATSNGISPLSWAVFYAIDSQSPQVRSNYREMIEILFTYDAKVDNIISQELIKKPGFQEVLELFLERNKVSITDKSKILKKAIDANRSDIITMIVPSALEDLKSYYKSDALSFFNQSKHIFREHDLDEVLLILQERRSSKGASSQYALDNLLKNKSKYIQESHDEEKVELEEESSYLYLCNE